MYNIMHLYDNILHTFIVICWSYAYNIYFKTIIYNVIQRGHTHCRTVELEYYIGKVSLYTFQITLK